MTSEEALRQVAGALAQEGFARRPACNMPAFEGSMTVLGRTLRLGVTFPRLDFTILPRVRLLDRATELPGHRAHVEDDDAICYSSPGTLVLDMHSPGNHALTVLCLVRRTLEEILSGSAEADLEKEFPQHWRGDLTVHVTLPPEACQGAAILVNVEGLGTSTLLLGRAGNDSGTVDLGPMRSLKGDGAPAYLARTHRLLTLEQGETLPSTLPEFLAWAGRMDAALPGTLTRALEREPGTAGLFVRAPNGCVGALVAPPEAWQPTRQDPNRAARMLRARPEKVTLRRIQGVPAHLGHVLGRNLAGMPTLAGRRVVLVGCGAIGSHLAKLLVQAGAGSGGGRLDLLDNQTLMAGNVGRHWLPPQSIGSSKAVACAVVLQSMFRGCIIKGHVADAMERLDLALGADLVIDATGEEPLSVALNEAVVRAREAGPVLLFVWLRGMGAAAQALFVPAKADGRGCLRCLRPRAGAWPQLDVMHPNLTLEEAPAACGEGAFTPYSVAAPVIAAGLAAKMALDWVAGKESPSFRTLRVDHCATVPVEDMDLPAGLACPACGVA